MSAILTTLLLLLLVSFTTIHSHPLPPPEALEAPLQYLTEDALVALRDDLSRQLHPPTALPAAVTMPRQSRTTSTHVRTYSDPEKYFSPAAAAAGGTRSNQDAHTQPTLADEVEARVYESKRYRTPGTWAPPNTPERRYGGRWA